jgi:hypothetical protein
MYGFIIGILCGGIMLAVAAIVGQRIYYRKIIHEKEQGIVRHIHERDQIAKELEYSNMEMKVMEKMLKTKVDTM